MVSFGKYLLSEVREDRLKQSNIVNPTVAPYEDRFRHIYDADLANWKHESKGL